MLSVVARTLDSSLCNNLHPINSVLATATNVNPTGTIKGTWVLLTSQSLAGSTIYYWKRTE